MIGIIDKQKKPDIEGNSVSFEDGFNQFYSENLSSLIICSEETADLSESFRILSDTNRKTFSHIACLKIKEKWLLISDSYINLNPNLKTLSGIISNAAFFAKKLDITQPRIAVLSAVEVVNPQMDSSVPACVMEAMGKRHQFGKDVFVEGPLSMDVSVSAEAARDKKVNTDVAGKADILIGHTSTIPQGIFKSLQMFAAPECLISIITDGEHCFPYILGCMKESDIKHSLEFATAR